MSIERDILQLVTSSTEGLTAREIAAALSDDYSAQGIRNRISDMRRTGALITPDNFGHNCRLFPAPGKEIRATAIIPGQRGDHRAETRDGNGETADAFEARIEQLDQQLEQRFAACEDSAKRCQLALKKIGAALGHLSKQIAAATEASAAANGSDHRATL